MNYHKNKFKHSIIPYYLNTAEHAKSHNDYMFFCLDCFETLCYKCRKSHDTHYYMTVNDIKTIGRGVENFHDNFINFNYYRELGMYCGLLKLVAKEEYDINGFDIKSNCLIVSTRQPFNTGVYHVTREDLAKGWKEFLFYMKKVAYYYYKGYRWN